MKFLMFLSQLSFQILKLPDKYGRLRDTQLPTSNSFNIGLSKGSRGKEILEQISKPRFFTELENRGLFSTATQRRKKGGTYELREKRWLRDLF